MAMQDWARTSLIRGGEQVTRGRDSVRGQDSSEVDRWTQLSEMHFLVLCTSAGDLDLSYFLSTLFATTGQRLL